jgi:hypothetical protein
MVPTPEAVADALAVAEMGGDLDRLAAVCRLQADHYEGDGRQRLLDAAEKLEWGAKVLAAMDGQQIDGETRAGN